MLMVRVAAVTLAIVSLSASTVTQTRNGRAGTTATDDSSIVLSGG